MIKKSDLEDRMGGGDEYEPQVERPAPTERRPRGGSSPESNVSTAERALSDRITKAKTLEPSDNERHCVDCWTKGRNAAIRAIEGQA